MPYDNNLTGILARNQRRRDDKDPSHTGSCEIDGKHFWLSAWVNEGKPGSKMAGQKYFSVKFRPKDAPAVQPTPAAPAKPEPKEKLEEDVPF